MFTGLVETAVPVLGFEPHGAGARLTLPRPPAEDLACAWDPAPGDSVAVSGCCLTVVEVTSAGETRYDLSAETLARTWFASQRDRPVNLERPLRLFDRLGGHLVTGHVDGLGRIRATTDSKDGGRLFTFEVEPGFERWLIDKGSVCVDGISLTVVAPRERSFDVAVIPETLRRTSLGTARRGAAVHLEADAIGKWVEKLAGPWT